MRNAIAPDDTMNTPAMPVILDTDIGDDVDDTWALCMLLGSPKVDLRLIVTAFDDVAVKTRLTAKILDRAGRTDVPIGMGVKTSDRPIKQAAWLGGYRLEDYQGAVHNDGVEALIAAIHATPAPVTICVIGPQTNLAAALARDPAIARKARIVAMAGSVNTGYDGQPGRDPEWNIRGDIAAARRVFAASWPITLAPLDVTASLLLNGDRYREIEKSPSDLAAIVVENYRLWAERIKYPESGSSVLHDTVAAYLTYDDAYLELENLNLLIDDEGRTTPAGGGRPVRCALRWKDRQAFENELVKSLTFTGTNCGDDYAKSGCEKRGQTRFSNCRKASQSPCFESHS